MDVPAVGWLPALLLLASAQVGGGLSQSSSFPAFVWRQDFADKPLPEQLSEAFGGVNVEGSAQAEWTREAGLDFFVGHAPGRNALHIDDATQWYTQLWEAYWDDRDASKLVRVPCLSEARTEAALAQQLERSLAARAGDFGLGVSLGDEVGLTRFGGPLDLCASDLCQAAFAEFLSASPRWSQLVPEAARKAPYPDTNETRLAWTAGDARHVALWMARREFNQDLFDGVLRRLSARCKQLAPQAPVGLVGLAGRTAFGGVGVETILPQVDFLEVYATLDTRELLYSLRGPRQQSWLTVFNEAGAPASAAWQVRQHWLRGGDAVVLWSDRELLGDASYFEATREAVHEVRGLRVALPTWRPAPAGLAIVHDPEAQALGWLRDALHDGPTWPKRFASYQIEHGTREVALRGLLRLAEDVGLLPGALPFEAIGTRTVARYPVLILNEQIVLEAGELERLEAYVEAGGHLLIHGRFDVWDLAGRPSELDALERLEAKGGERVQLFEFDGERYLEGRCKTPRPHAERSLASLRAVLSLAKVQLPTWLPVAAEETLPWLRAEVPGDEQGVRLCAAIPGLQERDERRALSDLEVRLQGTSSYDIEWLEPRVPGGAGSVSLQAGEMLVFKLTPR